MALHHRGAEMKNIRRNDKQERQVAGATFALKVLHSRLIYECPLFHKF